MSNSASSSVRSTIVNPRAAQRVYQFMAVLAALLVLISFARTYYAKVFFATPELSSLVHVHGIIMSL